MNYNPAYPAAYSREIDLVNSTRDVQRIDHAAATDPAVTPLQALRIHSAAVAVWLARK